MRRPHAQHVAVRLADEGIPVLAIGRALLTPAHEIYPILREAIDLGYLLRMPAPDWKVGTHREDRALPPPVPVDRKLERRSEIQVAFSCNRAEALVLAALLRERTVERHAIYTAARSKADQEDKAVDVYISMIRRKLRPHGVTIVTVRGTGYFISPSDKDKINTIIAAAQVDIFAPPTSPDAHPSRPGINPATVRA